MFFALFGSLFFLTQYLQFVLGYTPLQAGLRVAPLALVLMVGAPLAGRLAGRLGNKVLVAGGHDDRSPSALWSSARSP